MSIYIFNKMSNTLSKILIVEDEPAIVRMYRFKLEKEGYSVHFAYNGEEGLAAAEEFRPDLILLDLRMPVMSGDEMLEKLRATDWGSSIRIVILTNISKAEAPASLRLMHVDRYIVKAHYTPAQVVNIVDEILKPAARKR